MSTSQLRNRPERRARPGWSALFVSCLVLAITSVWALLGDQLLIADDDEKEVVETEESLAPSDHTDHEDSATRIPKDAAGQRAELLRMARQCDLDILFFGQKDQEKREAEINTFVAAALDGDYSQAGDFAEIMDEIRKARLDNDNAMFCHCGKNLNSNGYCSACTPKPNKLRDE